MIKITKREKPKTEPKIVLPEHLEVGTVFKNNEGAVGLRICDDKVLLLKFTDGDDWLEIADGYYTTPIAKVLGKITEIIVD